MTMPERVARALYECWLDRPEVGYDGRENGARSAWSALTDRSRWMKDARAVLASLRDPDQKTLKDAVTIKLEASTTISAADAAAGKLASRGMP